MDRKCHQKKRQTEYLFLDIEWNQTPGTADAKNRAPVQIGIVSADQNLQERNTFSKTIRLSDPAQLNRETVRVAHMNKSQIMQAQTEDIVFDRVRQTFPAYKYVVVWTEETYELFKRGMKTYGLTMPKHQAVILQDVLMYVASGQNRQIGFEKALRLAKIAYAPENLHYSKHDAKYLYMLFKQCYEAYFQMAGKETCVANMMSGKLHTQRCRYAKAADQGNFLTMPKTKLFQGYTVCKLCSGGGEWNYLDWDSKKIPAKQPTKDGKKVKKSTKVNMRSLPLTEDNIRRICSELGLSCSVGQDVIFIKTVFSRWAVYIRNGKVQKLHHENYRAYRSEYLKKQKKYAEGYHEQKLPSDNFYDVAFYIKCHDESFIKKMGQKSRIEQLFDMIQ